MRNRRQLSDEETRLYVAGMNAHRRGEHSPKEVLPVEQYRIWRRGWNRVGRTNNFKDIMRSDDHLTLVQGRHCIHTEVETFDDALKVLEIRQLRKAQSEATKGRPATWRGELGAHKGRKRLAKSRERALVIGDQRASEFERLIVGRVVTAIESLKLGVEEMSLIAAMGGVKYPAVNPKSLTDIIITLSKLIKQDAPSFDVQRTTVHPVIRHCATCAAQLDKSEIQYCRHCDPETESERNAAQLRREHYSRLAGLRHEANQVSKLTRKLSRKILDVEHDNRDQGHGGRSRQITGSVEVGGRQEDILVGSEDAHQLGAGGTGDAES